MHISFLIPSLGSGGAERVVSILASSLAERGHEVDVVMLANRHRDYRLSEKVNVVYLDCEQDQGLKTGKRYRLRLQKIRRAIKQLHPDVAVSFMSETNIDTCLSMRFSRIPLVVSERNDPKTDPASRLKQWLRRLAYHKPRGFVFQTPDAQAYFSRRIQKRSEIILNPLSEKLPLPWQNAREKRVVAVGRLNRQKNFPMLIEAFSRFLKEHPDYILEIYGDGVLRESLQALVSEKGLADKVLFRGFCTDVHEKIRSAEMFVMTSDFEGMPNALAEAMAMGIPCISTDCPCGGPRFLMKHMENGILVPVKDTEKTYRAMCYMVENPEEASKMGQEAYHVRERMDASAITEQWERFIQKCCEE